MKELELERKLMNESFYLRNIDKSKCTIEKQRQIEKDQDETYKKWKLLNGILKERENEKINKTIM